MMISSPFEVLFCCSSALILASLKAHVVIARPPCHVEQITITSSQGTRCVDCPKCPQGQGLSPQCGSYIKPGLEIACVRCPAGESYSDGDDILACKPCSICGPNEETLKPCTPTQNAVCGKCHKGFYGEVTGDCKPCSRCCGHANDEVLNECTNQGLSAKESCRYDLNTIECARKDNASTNTTTDIRGPPPTDYAVGGISKHGMNNLFGLFSGVAVLALAVCVSFILYCWVRLRCQKETSTLTNYLIQYEPQQHELVTTKEAVQRVILTSTTAGHHEPLPQVVTGTICSLDSSPSALVH